MHGTLDMDFVIIKRNNYMQGGKSLKKTLYLHIQSRYPKSLTIQEVHIIARSLNKKESNAERRLRPSESPCVETIRNEKGHITGYRWKPKEFFRPNEKEIKTLEWRNVQEAMFPESNAG